MIPRSLYASLVFALVGCLGAPADAQSPSVSFSSSVKGNIFVATRGDLSLQISGADAVVSGSVILKNEQGVCVGEVVVPAGVSKVSIPLEGKGFYQAEAALTLASGGTAQALATAAVVGPLPEESARAQSRLGLWTVQGDPELVKAAGARWNRAMTTLKTLPQEFVQTGKPAPAEAAKPPTDLSGFSYVGNISFGLPEWLLDNIPADHPKGFSNPFQAPKDWAALSELVKAFAKWHPRWSEFPCAFELYNEPEWHWKGSSEDLVRFEATVADAIKSVHPEVKILGPGFSSVRIKDPVRLDLVTVHGLGLFDHLDGLVVHAYVDGSAPEGQFIQRIEDLQAYLAKIERPDFPIHLTEFGWCTKPGTWQRPVDELTQAQYTARSLTLLAALGVENATYFCLLFKAAPNEGERSFSILHNDLTPKPAYSAYANVARWLAGVQGKGRWLRLTPNTHAVVFRKEKQTLAVVWDTKESRAVPLSGATGKAEDMMGRAVTQNAQGEWPISPSPIYVELENDGLYNTQVQPPLRVIRGNTVKIPQAPGAAWITPAPLRVENGMLEAPQDAPQGPYLLLSQSGKGLAGLSVEVLSPLEVSPARVTWPASEKSPQLALDLRSHASQSLAVTANGRVEKVTFSGPGVKVAPSATAEMRLPLNKLEEGKRYRGTLTIESREESRRDRSEQPLDLTIVAAPPTAPGAKPDWSAIPATDFSSWDPFGGKSEKEDCSATLQASYNAEGLYLRICVRDDQHVQHGTPENLWAQDSIQLGLDADAEKTWEANDLFGLKGHRVFEYGVAWDGQKSMNWRWISYTPGLPVGVSEPRLKTEARRNGDITEYEITFPWAILGLDKAPVAGSAIGISLAVTDVDPGKAGRRGLRLFGGITDGKDPEKYGKLWLR